MKKQSLSKNIIRAWLKSCQLQGWILAFFDAGRRNFCFLSNVYKASPRVSTLWSDTSVDQTSETVCVQTHILTKWTLLSAYIHVLLLCTNWNISQRVCSLAIIQGSVQIMTFPYYSDVTLTTDCFFLSLLYFNHLSPPHLPLLKGGEARVNFTLGGSLFAQVKHSHHKCECGVAVEGPPGLFSDVNKELLPCTKMLTTHHGSFQDPCTLPGIYRSLVVCSAAHSAIQHC